MPGTPPTPPTRVECVMIAGCSMRDSGAPRDAASAKTRVRVVSSIAASSVVAVPLVFAALTYITFIGAGIREQGIGHFLASQLLPPGLPKVMYLLITPIEFLSNFIVRPVTLTLRLLCNMISGHLLLGMTYFGTAILLHELSVLSAASALTGAAMFVMTGFEVFVAFLQAYIFTILSTVYIKLSVEHH